MRIILSLWDFSHSKPYQFSYSFAGIFPTRRPNSAVGIFSSQSLKVMTPLMGFLPHESNCESDTIDGIFLTWKLNSAAGIFLTRRIKFAGTTDRTTPTREHRKRTKPYTCQVKYPGVKGKHSEVTRQFQTTHGKINQARFMKLFPFQIQKFIPNISITNTLL